MCFISIVSTLRADIKWPWKKTLLFLIYVVYYCLLDSNNSDNIWISMVKLFLLKVKFDSTDILNSTHWLYPALIQFFFIIEPSSTALITSFVIRTDVFVYVYK